MTENIQHTSWTRSKRIWTATASHHGHARNSSSIETPLLSGSGSLSRLLRLRLDTLEGQMTCLMAVRLTDGQGARSQ